MDAPKTHEFNLIYVFSRDAVPGALKIGKTTVTAKHKEDLPPNCEAMNKAFAARVRSAITFGVDDIHLLYTEVAAYDAPDGEEHDFDDHEVHSILEHSHYKKKTIKSQFGEAEEWYEVDLDIAIKAIAAHKNGQTAIDGPVESKAEKVIIDFREEQSRAINETIFRFQNGNKMLWNAKMRFGKTLCALEVIRREQYKKVLILTHRPTVRSGWFEDYHNLDFTGFLYGSKEGKKDNQCDCWKESVNGKDVKKYDKEGKDFDTLECGDAKYIYFASMQDLRGSKYIYGSSSDKGFDKDEKILDNDWDLIILDEAHEGTQTDLGQKVISRLTKGKNPKLLFLSGTPYNLLSQFKDEEIYTWDYVMEQTAKNSWCKNHPNQPNPYRGLAQMHIYTYDLNDVYAKNHEVYTKDDFFSFSEFFRVWSGNPEIDGADMPEGKFVHEDDVRSFLDLLCDNSGDNNYYPFATQESREELDHTFWLLPGVKQAKALEKLINEHKLHLEYGYEVVNVAGNHNISELMANEDTSDKIDSSLQKEEKEEKKDLDRVQAAVKKYPKTITLSCGRLTTGVSVPEWVAVFMLSGGYKTGAAGYMQAIFRSQTPYKGARIKPNCYAYDFAPDRTLTVIDEYIKAQPASRAPYSKDPDPFPQPGESTPTCADTEQTLRHMPVIAMRGGKEVEYDALSFVHEVNETYANFVREHGYKGRALTKDFASFTHRDHMILASIGKLFSGGKIKTNADGTMVVADNELTGEGETNTQKGKSGKNKSKNKTRKPKNKKKATEQELRRQSQSVLDQIYVRFPLLMFGAVDATNKYTIQQLLDAIDEESWQEFMPTGFKKAMFWQIAHLIKLDALVVAGMNDVKAAQAADRLPIEDRIMEMAKIIHKFHFPDKETVLTPWWVVNMHMTHTLGGYNFFTDDFRSFRGTPELISKELTDEIFGSATSKVLEVNSKSGVYPLWLTYTLFRYQCKSKGAISDVQKEEIWKSILKDRVFVLCKTRMAAKITHRVLAGYKDYETHCVFEKDLIKQFKEKKKQEKLIKKIQTCSYWGITSMAKKIKFTAAVGNPPYQITVAKAKTTNGQKRVMSIFHHFQIASDQVARYTSLIYPGGRWIHQSGKGLAPFGKAQINDPHLVSVEFFPNTHDIFEKADLADGISIVVKDNEKKVPDGTPNKFKYIYSEKGISVPYMLESPGDELIPLNPADKVVTDNINNVVAQRGWKFLGDSILSQKLFGIESDFVEKNPKLVRLYKEGSSFDEKTEIKLLTNDKGGKSGRAKWYIANRSVIKTGLLHLDKWKVVVSSANAGGQKRSNQLEILDNLSAFGRVKVALRTFDTEDEAKNFYKYVDSNLIRFAFLMTDESLTSLGKQVPDICNYKSDNGIIDFTKDIDSQLYDIFNISEPAQKYIASILKSKKK